MRPAKAGDSFDNFAGFTICHVPYFSFERRQVHGFAIGRYRHAVAPAGYGENNPAAFIILNTVTQKYRAQSILFGKLLNTEFVDTDARKSRGVKEQGVLVLAHSAMPAVLVETGYINNPGEEEYLNSESGQNEIARSIVRAVKTYRNLISVK